MSEETGGTLTKAEALNASAQRILQMVRQASPGVRDVVLFEALTVAAGKCFADALFPVVTPESHAQAGVFFSAGVALGMAERTKQEKESCKGIA